MLTNKDVAILATDDAVVTLGAQFREVAIGLLITQLRPEPSSYAWYFLAGSVPALLLARWYGTVSLHWAPRRVMIAAYWLRLLMVLWLWRVHNFWLALGSLGMLSLGSQIYGVAQAQYVAQPGDMPGTRHIVARLRQAESAVRLGGPMLAGILLGAGQYRSGFIVSAACYGIALWVISHLGDRPPVEALVRIQPIVLWRMDWAAFTLFILNFLIWQANTWAMSYLFHILNRHAFGYGVMLSAYGGSGLVAGWLLRRIQVQHETLWLASLFGLLAGCWFVLFYGASFEVFVFVSGVEGMATWLIQDVVVSRVLSAAPSGQAGVQRARLGRYEKLGSIAGLLVVLVTTGLFPVQAYFKWLAQAAALWVIVWLLWAWKTKKTKD